MRAIQNRAIVAALTLTLILALAAGALPVRAQEGQVITVPFSDPSRAGVVKIEQTHGSIRVESHAGADVQIEAVVRENDEGEEDEGDPRRDGLRRWGSQSVQLEVVEEDNFMSVDAGTSWSKVVDLTVRVPAETHLRLECVHSGEIHVRGVRGEHELMNTHGSIEALEVGGSVVAETTHGDVTVSFSDVDGSRSMAFSTFRGDIDVTFPATLRADVRIDPGSGGEIYTNFDIREVPQAASVREESDGKRTKVVVERETRGTIQGGGPEMHFETWSGAIYIRKR